MNPLAADRDTPVLREKTDEELVTLTRLGNSAAFDTLFRRYSPPLVRYSERVLGASNGAAEDVVQEVMTAARTAIDTDQGPINVGPWLYKATRNRCLNHLRDESAAKRPPANGNGNGNGHRVGEEYLERIASRVPSAAEQAERRAELRQLIDDLYELPDTQRTALVMRELEGHGYQAVAEAMGTTVPSVKSLLVRARLALTDMAEARQLDCDDVRVALARAEQKLGGLRPAERSHVRNCKECAKLRKRLKATSKGLTALSPLGLTISLQGALASAVNGSGAAAAGGAATAAAGAAGVAGAGGAGAATGGILAGTFASKGLIATVAVSLVAAGSVYVPTRDGSGEKANAGADDPAAVASSAVKRSTRAVAIKPQAKKSNAPAKVKDRFAGAASIIGPASTGSDASTGTSGPVVVEEPGSDEPKDKTGTRGRKLPSTQSDGTRSRPTPVTAGDETPESPAPTPGLPDGSGGAETSSTTGGSSPPAAP